ncbi:hypothetical protein Tco_0060011 [Tanacetum coccineum]
MAEQQNPQQPPPQTPQQVQPESPDTPIPYDPAPQVDFSPNLINIKPNNEVATLYPEHNNSAYFLVVFDFISKSCLRNTFPKTPSHQYKEYLVEFCFYVVQSESTLGHDALADSITEVDPRKSYPKY